MVGLSSGSEDSCSLSGSDSTGLDSGGSEVVESSEVVLSSEETDSSGSEDADSELLASSITETTEDSARRTASSYAACFSSKI